MRASLLLFLSAALLAAQSSIVVTVMNEGGEALPGALIDHVGGPPLWGAETDASGKASVAVRGPRAVVRLRGYRSSVITLGTEDLRVVLEPTTQKAIPCSSSKAKAGFFDFPPARGIKDSAGGKDIDYSTIIYARDPKPKHNPTVIHGSGPNWSRGVPRLQLVEESTQFQEASVALKDFWYVDSRGVKNGTYWRFIGTFAETIAYEGLSKDDADAFDRFLDTACVRPDLIP